MQEAGAPAEGRQAWAAVLAAMVGLALSPSTIVMMGLGTFIGPLEQEFGWSRTQIVLSATIVSYVVVLAAPLQGALIDRFGARRVILPSIPIFALALALLYFMPPNLSVFYAAWVLVAASSLGLLPIAFLRVASGWFEKRLGLAIGVANAGIGIGNILVPLTAAYLIANFGWRWAYVGFGILVMLIVLPVCMIFLKEKIAGLQGSQQSSQTAPVGIPFRAAVKQRYFWILCAAFFFLGLVNVALITQQIPLLIDAGVTPQKAALVQAVFGGFVLFGRMATGYLLDYVSAPLLMVAVCLGGLAACLIYASGASGDIIFLCAALIGLVVGAEFDVLSFMTKKHFGMAAFGRIYGAIYSVFQIGAGLGVAAFAFSYDLFSGYALGLKALGAALIIAGALFIFLMDHPWKPRKVVPAAIG